MFQKTNTQETSSFQKNLRNTFIHYSLIPVFLVTCITFLVIVLTIGYSTIQYNITTNEKVSEKITWMVTEHELALKEIEKVIGTHIGTEQFNDMRERQEIYKILYDLKNKEQEQSQFFLLDKNQRCVFSFDGEIPAFLSKPEYNHWGIMEQLREHTNEDCIVIQNQSMCVGKKIQDLGQDVYFAVFVIPSEDVEKLIGHNNGQLVVTNELGWIFYNNCIGVEDNLNRIDKQFQDNTGFTRFQGRMYYVTMKNLKDINIEVISITDAEKSLFIICLLLVSIVVIFGAIGAITLYSTKMMAIKYTQDIDEIANAFEKVKRGELDVKVYTKSSKEFQAIARDFNLMLEGLRQQIAQNKEMTEHVAFAQVKQLESQFNPHFLFNTLDNIRFMTKIDIKAADKMIVSLSRLLSISIRDPREEITVSEDIENLQSYFNILQIRFNKRFSYEYDIDENILECLIPKLMIQPLVENAVKYGFQSKEQLHVLIRGYEKDNKLFFICKDNGSGMEKEVLEEIREQLKKEINTSQHTGLYNIHRRIHLLYKENFGMKIESQAGEGTSIILSMPYHLKEVDKTNGSK